jgi:biopolymer transport protein ExbD
VQATPGSDTLDDDEDEGGIFGEINITPLTDVFLVLLIIMMVVSASVVEEEKERAYEKGLLSERALQVMTPSSGGDSDIIIEDVIISVLPDRTIFIENDEVALEELEGRLLVLQQANPATRIVLRGDRAAPYEVVMDVIARCTNSGLSNIALASQDSPSAP